MHAPYSLNRRDVVDDKLVWKNSVTSDGTENRRIRHCVHILTRAVRLFYTGILPIQLQKRYAKYASVSLHSICRHKSFVVFQAVSVPTTVKRCARQTPSKTIAYCHSQCC